jgi:hypothetical protein
MLSHYTEQDTHMIDVTTDTPVQVIVGFDHELSATEQGNALAAVQYWAGSPPIAGKAPVVQFNVTYEVMIITADFGSGYFDGDLTHHNAIGYGDEDFNIGLLELLVNGYEPATRRGSRIPATNAAVRYIQLVYDADYLKGQESQRSQRSPNGMVEYRLNDLLERVQSIEATLRTLKNVL